MFPIFLFQHYFQTFWKEIIFRVSTRLDQICVNENTAEKQIEEFFWQEDVSVYLKSNSKQLPTLHTKEPDQDLVPQN